MWKDIYKPNSIGSEGGTIIADEEYKESCRITLKDVKDMMQLHVEYMDV